MEHVKICNAIQIDIPNDYISIEGPIDNKSLLNYHLDDELCIFRPALQQYEALMEIAGSPEGRVIVARNRNKIIGYVTFHYPDKLERWSDVNIDTLLELGAIEVIKEYRRFQIAQNLLRVAMMDDSMEDYIVIATNYYWHWDLKGTGLGVYDYRKIIKKVMSAGGLEYMPTDDPDICIHSANCLTVRIGNRVSDEDIRKFDMVRLKNQFMY